MPVHRILSSVLLSMDYRNICACAFLFVSGLWLVRLSPPIYRRIGLLAIWVATGFGAYVLSGNWLIALAALAAWIFFPAWELMFILRQLRLPQDRQLTNARAPRDEFEELVEITAELEKLGFEQLDECSLRPAEHEQYYRIFSRPDGRIQATIGYTARGTIGFHFAAFASETADNRRWVTWDYPLTYGLLMPPNVAVYRALHCADLAELYQAHLEFLALNEIPESALTAVPVTAEAARARLEQALDQQVEYNVSQGVLEPAVAAGRSFSYSWRGTLYVAGQVLRDLLWS